MKQKSTQFPKHGESGENTEISHILCYLADLELTRTHAILNVWECTNSHKMEIFCGKPYHSQAMVFEEVRSYYETQMFCTISPICLMLTWDFSLCNIGTAFAETSYYQKINRYKIKIVEKWCLPDDNTLGFCLCNIIWSLLDNITPSFYLCNASITKTLNTIFSFTMLSGATWTTLHKVFFPYNVVPKVSRQIWTGFFPVKCA